MSREKDSDNVIELFRKLDKKGEQMGEKLIPLELNALLGEVGELCEKHGIALACMAEKINPEKTGAAQIVMFNKTKEQTPLMSDIIDVIEWFNRDGRTCPVGTEAYHLGAAQMLARSLFAHIAMTLGEEFGRALYDSIDKAVIGELAKNKSTN